MSLFSSIMQWPPLLLKKSQMMWWSLSLPQQKLLTIPVIAEETRELLLHFQQEKSITDEERDLLELLDNTFDALQMVSTALITLLQKISKHLKFWQAQAQGSKSRRLQFMLLERGPWAFVESVGEYARRWWKDGDLNNCRSISERVTAQISARVAMLTLLQDRLSSALGETHREVDRLAQSVGQGKTRRAVTVALAAVHEALLGLEDSYVLPQSDHLNAKSLSAITLMLQALVPRGPLGPAGRGTEWSNEEIRDAISAVHDDVAQINGSLATLAAAYQSPSTISRYWIRYTGTTVGLGIAATWVVGHSRLAGSDDLDRWGREAWDSAVAFAKEHIEAPIEVIRDDLFKTFRSRPQGLKEAEEVLEVSRTSLRNMLVEFNNQTATGTATSTATESQLMAVVMDRYEKELVHPLRNLVGGELMRAFLIQVQKMKLDVETAMLELDQLMRSNEINFAILTALPALLLAMGAAALARSIMTSTRGVEGRGRAAQLRRRLLMADTEKAVLTSCLTLENDPDGLKDPRGTAAEMGQLIFHANRLYISLKRPASKSGEWPSVRGDILDLAKTDIPMRHKLLITARMERVYDCLAPTPAMA